MRFASRVDALGGKTVSAWDIHFAAFAAKQRGEDVILLSVGDPDFATPEPIVEAAVAALRAGDTHYTEIPGRPALRAAIAGDHQNRTGQDVTGDNVIVLTGAQNGLFAASMCLFEPGDEVIALEPAYLTYEASLGASGARMVRAQAMPGGGFRPDPSAIAALIGPRTRAILFANPNNPTGVVMTRAELAAIADLARAHDLWVIVDEVYGALTFEAPHLGFGALPGMAERTVTVSSLSKSHAMTGWRSGWAIAPRALIEHMHKLSICMVYGLPGFIMEGALAALQAGESAIAPMRAAYRRRRDLAFDRLSRLAQLRCVKPEAGMFMLIDVRASGLAAQDFCWDLFREEGVCLLDASAFGASAAGHVRLCFAIGDEALEAACERIARFVQWRETMAAA